MLNSLTIENYAIIAKVHIDFDSSLNIITGETGAGKSILLGALGLIMGNRADSKVLYDKENKCVVEAVFTKVPATVNKLLEENDLDVEEELIIRREIVKSGRSRAFVNDTPTKLELLQKLSSSLVDLNQQFRILEIQDKSFQLSLVDALAKNEKSSNEYSAAYSEYRKTIKELADLESSESAQLKELDFLKFQFEEMTTLALEGGEQTSLESDLQLLDKAEDISLLMGETGYLLSEAEPSVRDQLATLVQRWNGYTTADEMIKEGVVILEEILNNVDTLSTIAAEIKERTQGDPGRLEEIRGRLDAIYLLQKKHGVNSVTELLDLQQDMEIRLSNIDNRSGRITELKNQLAVMKIKLEKLAHKLSGQRIKVFPKLEKSVNSRLKELSMGAAAIKISNEVQAELGNSGIDKIDILFKANKGTDFMPIRKVASGGETSRLMLSIKASVADSMALPTMIFDEIDTGVSGDVAGKMGAILKQLSDKHQLICITHSPQVSARAIQHLYVYKEETKSRTLTHVKVLDKEERIIELAKMLSGNPPSSFALENAKDLLST